MVAYTFGRRLQASQCYMIRPCLKTKLSLKHSDSVADTSYLEPVFSLLCRGWGGGGVTWQMLLFWEYSWSPEGCLAGSWCFTGKQPTNSALSHHL